MKTRIQWRAVLGYSLLAAGGASGAFAPWPINGMTILAMLLLLVGGFLVGTVIQR